jgi:ABC-type phosphate/phosphonate transport system substrate-binding protein
MDPLADQLACDCVKGYAQRRYPKLCQFLSRQLGRPVEFVHNEALTDAIDLAEGRVDLIIGKQSLVRFEATETATPVRPIAMLTDKAGSTDLTGLFVVRSGDPAHAVTDLKGKRIVFGAADSDEKHTTALAALHAARLPTPTSMPTANSGSSG